MLTKQLSMSCVEEAFYKSSPKTSYMDPMQAFAVFLIVVAVLASICCYVMRRKPAFSSCGHLSAKVAAPGGKGKVVELKSAAEMKEAMMGTCVVMFHAEWCGHCKNAMPFFHMTAEEMPAVLFCTMNESVLSPEEMQMHGVTAFPHFVKHEGGKQVKKQTGGMDKEGMLDFAK